MKLISKKFLSILLSLIVILSLTGCKSSTSGTDEAASTDNEVSEGAEGTGDESADDTLSADDLVPEEGASLTLWGYNEDYNTQIVELWNAKYPDIPLKTERIANSDVQLNMETTTDSGSGCDVAIMAHNTVASAADTGLLLQLDYLTDYIKQNYSESMINSCSLDGAIYGAPFTCQTTALFYNKALVQEPVKTWDELFAFAKTYNDPSQNKYACAWQAVDSYFAHGIISTYGYELFGPNHNDPSQLGWDTQEAIDGLTFYQSLNQVYPVKSTDCSWDAMSSLFKDGKVPYVITGPWDINPFTKAGIDFGICNLPTTSDGTPTKTMATVNAIVVSSYTQYPQAAMLLAKFLVEEDSLKLVYDVDTQIPASTAGQNYDYIKNNEYLAAITKQMENSEPIPNIPEMSYVWTPYATMITSVWDDVQKPEEALKKAIDEYNAAIEMAE